MSFTPRWKPETTHSHSTHLSKKCPTCKVIEWFISDYKRKQRDPLTAERIQPTTQSFQVTELQFCRHLESFPYIKYDWCFRAVVLSTGLTIFSSTPVPSEHENVQVSICSGVQKFPAWHTKAAPNGKCCEGYIVPSVVRLMYQLKSVLK